MSWTIHARITALVAGLVIAVGGILLLANYWWLTRNLPSVLAQEHGGEMFVVVEGEQPIPLPTERSLSPPLKEGRTASGVVDTGQAASGTYLLSIPTSTVALVRPLSASSPEARAGEMRGALASGPAEAAATVAGRPDTISIAVAATSQGMTTWITQQLGQQLLLLMMVLTIAAVTAGWVAARRSLAPVDAMNERVRRLGASSLSERLPVDGPQDEIAALGLTFNDLLDRVERAVAREHRLVANLAHELRTPLANQRLVLEVAMERDGQGAEADAAQLMEAARTALQQNIRTQRLVEQLLMLARIEQARDGVFQMTAVDMLESVEEIVAAPTLTGLGPAGVQVVLGTVPAGRAIVRAEPLLLDCLIGNLLENAVRHNVEDGKVWISFPAPPPAMGPELLIENTGPVVPAEVLPTLFEPLRQGPLANRNRKHQREGLGLGLALVVAIAQRFDVALQAEPRTDGGLRIRLRWPAL